MSDYEVRDTGPGGTRQVHFSCGRCAQKLRAPLSGAGKQDTCPGCGHRFTVPGDQTEPVPCATGTGDTPPHEDKIAASIERIDRCRRRSFSIARVTLLAGALLAFGAGVVWGPAPEASVLLVSVSGLVLTIGAWAFVIWIVFLVLACTVQYAEARRLSSL